MTTFTPQMLGRAENALRAVLARSLNGTGITYHQWVLLTASEGGVGRADLIARATDGLKISPETVEAEIRALTAIGYMSADGEEIRLTPQGADWYAARRAVVGRSTVALFGDLPEDDMAATARILTTITERANALLA